MYLDTNSIAALLTQQTSIILHYKKAIPVPGRGGL
jgi:hypothetical protein